jgi:hypothetical protein
MKLNPTWKGANAKIIISPPVDTIAEEKVHKIKKTRRFNLL